MKNSPLNFCYPFIKLLIIFFASTLLVSGVDAQPYIPRSQDIVVETLPDSIVALARELRADSASRDPGRAVPSERDLQALQQQAFAAYRVAAETGEPRAYGRALALLERWPDEQEKPALMHVLMAAVLQHNHDFEPALVELQSALAIEPRNAQAHLMRAQISLVIADYDAARDSCLTLQSLVRYPLALNCHAQLDGVTGRAEQALAAVTSMLQKTEELSAQDQVELNITAAGIAHRLGFSAEAEQHYIAALQMSPANGYVLVNYAAMLIESQRFDDVVSLLDALADSAMSTEMQILLAEALSASPSQHSRERAQKVVASVQEVFDAAAMRGEGLPNKELARFALTLRQRPDEALAAAKKNWVLQKEPSDTLLLAQAARSASDVEQLMEILRWTQLHETQDIRLTRLFSEARL